MLKVSASLEDLIVMEQVDWNSNSRVKKIQQAVNRNNVSVVAFCQSKIIDLWMDKESAHPLSS